MRKIIYIVYSITIFFLSGKAQDISSGESISFNIYEALDFATEHAYEVANSQYDLKASKKQIWNNIALGLPQVSISANYDDDLTVDNNPINFSNTKKFKLSANVNATQMIFNGSYFVGVAASRVFYKLHTNQLEKIKQNIKEAVWKAYFYVLSAEMNYETLKDNLETNKEIYKETKAYCEEGLREDTDADQAEMSVRTLEIAKNEAKRSITVARTTLKYLMGIDVSKTIVLNSSIEELIAQFLLIKEYNGDETDWTNHIDYRILETEYNAEKLSVKNERVKFLPTISAFYRWGRRTASNQWNLTKSDMQWYKSSVIGLQLSLPIFTSWMKRSKLQQAKIKMEKSMSKINQVLQKMKKDKVLANNILKSAEATYLNTVKNRELAKKILKKTQNKYKEGVSSSIELAQIEEQYLNAHRNYIKAMIDLLEAGVSYRRVIGNL